MSLKGIRRWILVAVIVAVPLEVLEVAMLRYVPQTGVPQNPSLWLRLGGAAAALIHAPWLPLSNYLCARFCPPRAVLWTLVISGGYLDTVIVVLSTIILFRLFRNVLYAR
jgi:hypothetical protein